jgi:hypothetical protein
MRQERGSSLPALALQMSAMPSAAVSTAHAMMTIEMKLGSEEPLEGEALFSSRALAPER